MEETKYIYADKSEYPEVCVQEKNRQYAAAMLGNVGACDSEMSAVSLYFYNGVIAEGKFEEIWNVFIRSVLWRCIIYTLLRHLRIYLEQIHACGVSREEDIVTGQGLAINIPETSVTFFRMHFAGSNRPLQNTADRKNGYRIVISGKFWSGSS